MSDRADDECDVEITADLVSALIAQQFPKWSGCAVTPVEPVGWDNRTFRLGGDMLVRLPSRGRYVSQVEKEQRWLPILAPVLPLPIPVPVVMGKPGNGYPWPWSVYRWLDGEPSTSKNIVDVEEFARDLAGFLCELYRVDATEGPPAGEHNFFRGGPVATYDPEVRDAISALADRIDTALATAVWEAALASTWERPSVWVHGDVVAANLLVREGRLAAVIDFGSSGVGDPACDLTIAWTLLSGAGGVPTSHDDGRRDMGAGTRLGPVEGAYPRLLGSRLPERSVRRPARARRSARRPTCSMLMLFQHDVDESSQLHVAPDVALAFARDHTGERETVCQTTSNMGAGVDWC